MRSVLWLLAAVLVFGLAGLAAFGLGTPPSPPLPQSHGPTTSDGQAFDESDAPAEVERAVVADGDDGAATETSEPMDGDDADERELAVDATARAPRIQVVRGEPPQPVAGAELCFLPEALARQRLDAGSTVPRYELPATFGKRLRTDSEGLAVLPREPGPCLCSVLHDGEFGFLVVPPRDRMFVLVLQTDETLRLSAQFADATAAAGVPIAVLQQRAGENGPARPLWQGDSDARGTVVLRHFQLHRQPNDKPDANEAFAAIARVPGASAVPFAGRPVQGDPVVVPVPPLGRIAVQVVDHAGTPVLAQGTIGLTSEAGPAAAPSGAPPLPRQFLAQSREKPPGEALVLLPFAEVMAPLRVHARFPEARRAAEVGPLTGPSTAGETRTVALPLGPEQALLAGRLLGPDGEALGGAPTPVEVTLWHGDQRQVHGDVHALDDGRFDWVLGDFGDREGFVVEFRLVPKEGVLGGAGEPLGARVRTGTIRGGRRIELGDVRLVVLPVLASGEVLDDAGRPIAGARVTVRCGALPAGNRASEMAPLRSLATRCDEQGRFTILGEAPPARGELLAEQDQHFAETLPLQAGAPHRLVLQRAGRLRGRVLLPDWLAEGAVSLHLYPYEEARKKDSRSMRLSRRSGGRFNLDMIRPGRFQARVQLRNAPEPLAVFDDVFVPPGDTRDPRLQPLDLRSLLFRYQLRAVDAAGQPMPLDGPILARSSTADGQVVESAFRWQRGRAELISTSPSAELTFFGRGLRTLRTTLAPGEQDVLLATLPPVQLELPGLRALCGPTRKVRISVILQGDTGLPGDLAGQDQRNGEAFRFQRWDLGRTSGGWLGVTDTIEVPLMQTGTYEVLLRPHATDSERSRQGQLSLGTFALDVEQASWQTVRVPLDTAAVLATLQQLDQQHAEDLARNESRGRNRNRGR
ncbi:MAG: hypothetical protein JNL12_12270 [Planctomycetes bacterium]|nr:hypothetical protein [Planctomycetota bacterium]